jgi:hypothetical protein
MFSSVLRGIFTSFWANLGWMRLPLPYAWYYGLMGLTVLSLLGFVVGYRQLRSADARTNYAFCGLAAVLPVAVLVVWIIAGPGGTNFQQGRYLFGSIVPIAIVLVAGWLNLAPAHYARWMVWGMVGGMVALDTAVWCNLAIPFFYR